MTLDKLRSYSISPGSNNSAAPNGWPEGMLPSDVNNCAREMMARLREWYADAEWIDHAPQIVSSTASTIVVSGDWTPTHFVGRAIRVNQSASQAGWISTAVYSAPNTTLGITGFTVSSPTVVEIGSVSSAASLPNNMSITVGTLSATTITASVLNATTLGTITTASFGTAAVSGTLTVGTLNATTVFLGSATQAQMEAGTEAQKPVTPSVMKHGPGVAKAWCVANTSGASITVGASHNVASVTRTTGDVFRFTWTTAFSSADYAVVVTPGSAGTTAINATKTATYAEVATTGSVPEVYKISVVAFGDFA